MSDLEKSALLNRNLEKERNSRHDMDSSDDSHNPNIDNFEYQGLLDLTNSRTAWYASKKIRNVSVEDDVLLVLQHGAGSSAMTFCLAANELSQIDHIAVIAFDIRGHGRTICENSYDMTISNLCQDFKDSLDKVKNELNWSRFPQLVFAGHSLGGSIVTNVANDNIYDTLKGIVVVEVVEGFAIDLLKKMRQYILKRPQTFDSMTQAIQWHINGNLLKNLASAKLTVPYLLEPLDQSQQDKTLSWRTNIERTEPFWEDWFNGLSSTFLHVSTMKMLVLAGTERLDKPLLIAQMQGKYQLKIMPDCGHFVHEDKPNEFVSIILEFVKRVASIELVPRPQVIDLPQNTNYSSDQFLGTIAE